MEAETEDKTTYSWASSNRLFGRFKHMHASAYMLWNMDWKVELESKN